MHCGNEWMDAVHSTGTTIMAMEFDGGVVMGADSRTSTGDYVANRVSDKLTQIADTIYCCRSGSAAHTQAIADMVAYSLDFYSNLTGEEPLVRDAAAEFQNYCYNYRESLNAGIIVGGWDKKKGGQVYSIPVGGMMTRQPLTIGGSGSTYSYGFVREMYREKMTEAECVELIRKALGHAMDHDSSSGGVIRIGVIKAAGIERKIFYNTVTGEPVVTGN